MPNRLTNSNMTKECDGMKKVLSIVVALTFMLGLIGCSSKEKIPSISEVSQMKYSEINEVLTGNLFAAHL